MLGGILYDGMRMAYPGWGFRAGGIFFVSAFVMAVSVVPLLFMPEGGIHYRKESGAAGADDEPARPAGNLRLFAMFLVAMLLINSGINILGAFRAQYLDLAEGFAASPRTISLVVNVEAAVLIAIGFFLGALGRKIGIKRLLAAGTASGIISMVLHAMAPGIGLIYLAAAFKGISDGCIVSSSYAFASTLIPPEKRGRYFAWYNATFFLSWGLAATFLAGPLIDRLIDAGRGTVFAYKAGLLSGAALMVLGLGLLGVLFRASKGQKASSTPIR